MAKGRSLRMIIQKTLFPEFYIRRRYEAFRRILECDRVCHEKMAKLEECYYSGEMWDFSFIERACETLARALKGMVNRLQDMAPGTYDDLAQSLSEVHRTISEHCLTSRAADESPPYVLSLSDPRATQERRAGGKAARLAIIAQQLNLPTLPGFVITASAFHHFLKHNGLVDTMADIFSRLDIRSETSLLESSVRLQNLIADAPFPPALEEALRLANENPPHTIPEAELLAVRSSAVGEDGELSFAGQYRSLLHIPWSGLTAAYKEVIRSKYSPEALVYRIQNGLLEGRTSMAVLVLPMLDARHSGVLYTQDPLSPSGQSLVVYGVEGYGEGLVSGARTPCRYVFLRTGTAPEPQGTPKAPPDLSVDVSTPGTHLGKDSGLSASNALQLAFWGLELEKYFGEPLDIEWCEDREGRLYLLQCRPLKHPEEEAAREKPGSHPEVDQVRYPVLLSGGETASPGVAAGKVFRIKLFQEIFSAPVGSVLVTRSPSPLLGAIIPRMKAVIADGGSVAGHFASIAREMGIPMIVNSARATSLLEHGADVTVDATRCMVYAGIWEGLEKWQSKNLHTLPDSPFRRKLKCLLTNITSLHLTDPASPQFTPEHCRSFHDIVRYAHEKTVEEIFSLSSRGAGLVRGSRKLESTLPISLYVLDLEGGMSGQKEERGSVRIEDIDCQSLKSLWAGLTHKDVQWSSHLRHADWQELDRISSGIFSRDSRLLSSFALISRDYLNVNIRFGYHFVVLDSFCGDEPRENYIGLQFEGGGGNFEGRRLRVSLMERILLQKGFEVQCKGDVLHAELRQAPCQVLCSHMEMLGRLLGTTRLLDIRLKDEEDIDALTESFFQDQ